MNATLNRFLFWFVFGLLFTMSMVMIVFGVLFIRDVYISKGQVAFGSFIFGIVLLVAGGGLLSSTIAETIRKLVKLK